MSNERRIFSLADAAMFEEDVIEGYNGAVDANASMPPVPHDNYLARVQYSENWPGEGGGALAGATDLILPHAKGEAYPDSRWVKRVSKDGQVFYMTFVDITTAENANPEHDGRTIRQECIMTYVSKRGTTEAQALLQGLDFDTLMLKTHGSQAAALDQPLSAGTLVGVELDWEARLFDKEAVQLDKNGDPILDDAGEQVKGVELFSVRGMKNFPPMDDGTYSPEITANDSTRYKIKETGEPLPIEMLPLRARNFRRRWVSKSKFAGAAAPAEVAQTAPASAPVPVAAPAAPVAARPAPIAAARPAASAAAPARPPAAPATRPAPRRVAG